MATSARWPTSRLAICPLCVGKISGQEGPSSSHAVESLHTPVLHHGRRRDRLWEPLSAGARSPATICNLSATQKGKDLAGDWPSP